MSTEPQFGARPDVIGSYDLDSWSEYLHYMYLPVVMPPDPWVRLPKRLEFMRRMLMDCIDVEGLGRYAYVYVTARRGFATPGNPLNRPGWHSDGFGTDDVNYIWTDRFPTVFAVGEFEGISDDHVRSIEQFEAQAPNMEWIEHEPKTLLRLTPEHIHCAPTITEGGERGFIKVSFSNTRYNLRGNSHNHLFDYDWHMWDRAELRNDPAYAGGDAGPQEAVA